MLITSQYYKPNWTPLIPVTITNDITVLKTFSLNIIEHLVTYQKSFFHILEISPEYSQFSTLKTIKFFFPLHVKSSVTGAVPL